MKFVIANFKMNKTAHECKEWAKNFCELIFKRKKPNLKVGCAPSFPYIETMKKALLGTDILVGAQNFYFEPKGAFTGEVSITQLKDLQVDFAIIGHSERRNIFKETDKLISKKLEAAVKNGILPILCVGENPDERKNAQKVIEKQLQVLETIKDTTSHVLIAYEPVWAIGTGIPATKKDIKEMTEFIKETAVKYIKNFSVLYGGSIDEKVAEEIKDVCDGGLVGSASLDPQKFYKICINFE